MTQARSLQSGLQMQDLRRQRSRNLRIGLVLVVAAVALFAGSILYILLYPAVH